jgi:3-hydroxybutyryl-CoA dehydratase
MPTELKVGDKFTHERTCDKYRPTFYAAVSGDFNPIHIDPEVGKKAGLGGVILQGLCTMAWAVEAVSLMTQDPGKIRRARVRFSNPVVPGDDLKYEVKVNSLQNGRATCGVSAKNQRGDDVLKVATVDVEL